MTASRLTRRSVLASVLGSASLATLTACAASPSRGGELATPSITGVEPAAGSLLGGETALVSGSGLDAANAVYFGSTAASSMEMDANGSLRCTVPTSYEYRPGDVVVSATASHTSTRHSGTAVFTYEARTPVEQQLAYAFAHWNDYNLTEFGTFNDMGGDCCNFVSQTLHARGWPMRDDWYNVGGADWSYEWIHVPTFDDWLRRNQAELGVRELPYSQRDEVRLGDIVVFDWDRDGSLDHTQIVSAIDREGPDVAIKMVGHNIDTRWRDVDEAITIENPGAEVRFWTID